MNRKILAFFIKERLFSLSLTLFALTSFIANRYPHMSRDEFEVLYILAMFLIVVKALQKANILQAIAIWFEERSSLILLLVATFLLSMFVTNDVALFVMIPITLALQVDKKDLLIILEAISANAASLLPTSNPQNLYIYWHYNLDFIEFVFTIAPFVIGSFLFVLFIGKTAFIKIKPRKIRVEIKKRYFPYLFFFLFIILAIFKIVSLYLLSIIFFYTLFTDTSLLKIDYMLLIIFYLFFGIADNLSILLYQNLFDSHIAFFTALLLSQIMSNVPTAVLLSNFTNDWQSLLWGVSVGGFGVLWGSLASIIAYRLYIAKYNNAYKFLVKFLFLNFLALLFGIGLFYINQIL